MRSYIIKSRVTNETIDSYIGKSAFGCIMFLKRIRKKYFNTYEIYNINPE